MAKIGDKRLVPENAPELKSPSRKAKTLLAVFHFPLGTSAPESHGFQWVADGMASVGPVQPGDRWLTAGELLVTSPAVWEAASEVGEWPPPAPWAAADSDVLRTRFLPLRIQPGWVEAALTTERAETLLSSLCEREFGLPAGSLWAPSSVTPPRAAALVHTTAWRSTVWTAAEVPVRCLARTWSCEDLGHAVRARCLDGSKTIIVDVPYALGWETAETAIAHLKEFFLD